MSDITLTPLDHVALKRQVAERQRFLDALTSVVGELLPGYGKAISSETSGNHVESILELRDFDGLSFWSRGAFSMFGSQEIKVQYRPSADEPDTLVLHVIWRQQGGTRVDVFDPSDQWQEALRALIQSKKQLSIAYAEGLRFRQEEETDPAETEKAAQRLRLT